MTVALTSNFLSKARGITLKDSAQVTWAINKNTNEITASAAGALGGTVTSVGLADGSSTPIYTITGSPVNAAGTLTFTLATQPANDVFAGPTSGGAAQPTFRALVAADIPTLTSAKISDFTTAVDALVSVGLADISSTAIYTITNSPQTHGTIDIALLAQVANAVFAGPTSGGSAQPTFRALVAADVPSSILPGSFSGFANPSASVGLAAVNGTATTAMRSDGAPALDVTITPTWSGLHKFQAAATSTPAVELLGSTSVSGAGPIANTQLYAAQADGSNAFVLLDAFAGSYNLCFRRAQNTGATPQAVTAGQDLGVISARGYDGSAYSSTSPVQIALDTSENWNSTSHGTRLQFKVTKNTTLVLTTAMTLENDAGLFMVGATGSSQGAGTINATGLYINGVPVISDSTMAWLAA